MKNKYTIWALVLTLCLLGTAVLAGCGGTPAKQEAPAPSGGGDAKVSGLTAPAFEQPVLITSVGQSADGQMVKALAERNSLKFTYEPLVKPDEVTKYKTLLMVVGGSSKGLGAAGINPAQEEQRAKDLIAKAKAGNVKIIVAHVGGESRRGDITDRFVTITAPQSDYMIVVADGDKDKIFAKTSAGKIPLDYPASIAEVGKFLKGAFK